MILDYLLNLCFQSESFKGTSTHVIVDCKILHVLTISCSNSTYSIERNNDCKLNSFDNKLVPINILTLLSRGDN